MIDRDFRIIVGDANGADKAFQQLLTESRYLNVVVFCSGQHCRNNIGGWETRHVPVEAGLKGRDLYAQKDKAMAAEADYGFVMWDGTSVGAITNVFEMLKRLKQVVVYASQEKECFTISDMADAERLLNTCDPETLSALSKKIRLPTLRAEVQSAAQGRLALL